MPPRRARGDVKQALSACCTGRDALLLFLRRKSNQKAAGGVPPVPRHRPPGDTPFVDYLPFAVAGLILPVVHTLRLPDFCVYPRVLLEGEAAG